VQDAWCTLEAGLALLQVRQNHVQERFARIEPFTGVAAGRESEIPEFWIIVVRGARNFGVRSPRLCHGCATKSELKPPCKLQTRRMFT
jgi:hypothetical protein